MIKYSVRESTLKQITLRQVFAAARAFYLDQPRVLIDNKRIKPENIQQQQEYFAEHVQYLDDIESRTTNLDEVMTIVEANDSLAGIMDSIRETYWHYI